ncbi:unnamed protein product [Polarella glacialis]|uniref:Voltage-dependent anion-selective channel n=1 Tax=Polarella glacialis TaxID=89957 RepID=A0A813EVQ4_POLGL|nr:unnamed protein product [Polarella glacialis]
MAPVKFDDIHKTVNEVLSDDYQTSGFVFKTKQKTSWDGAVLSSQVDLFPAKESCMTPAKLTWKLPAPLGFSAICIDKLEMDKAGKFKLEASTDKIHPELKLECKSDLADISKITAGLTYTGVKDTQLKFETKATNPQDFVCEVMRTQGLATFGLKLTPATLTSPEVGARITSGPFFASLSAKEAFGAFSAHGLYKVSPELKCAATYNMGGKQDGQGAVGVVYQCNKSTSIKAKVQQDQSLSCTVKSAISPGFTLLGGGKYDSKKGDFTYGLQLSVE